MESVQHKTKQVWCSFPLREHRYSHPSFNHGFHSLQTSLPNPLTVHDKNRFQNQQPHRSDNDGYSKPVHESNYQFIRPVLESSMS